VTFEEEGKGGHRQVGFTNGTVEDVDESRYTQLWSGKGGSSTATAGPPTGGAGGSKGGGPAGRPAGAPTGPPGN
jgi:hypothetical protein